MFKFPRMFFGKLVLIGGKIQMLFMV